MGLSFSAPSRRFESGKLTDNELYWLLRLQNAAHAEKGFIALECARKPWYFTDYFAA